MGNEVNTFSAGMSEWERESERERDRKRESTNFHTSGKSSVLHRDTVN